MEERGEGGCLKVGSGRRKGEVGEMGNGGKPSAPSSTGCVQVGSGEREGGEGSGCLLTRSQSEFRAFRRRPRPSIHSEFDWRSYNLPWSMMVELSYLRFNGG